MLKDQTADNAPRFGSLLNPANSTPATPTVITPTTTSVETSAVVLRIRKQEADEAAYVRNMADARAQLDREAADESARHAGKREAERAEAAASDQRRLAEQEARINRPIADIAERFAAFIAAHDSNRTATGMIRTQANIPSGEQRWIAATQRIITDLEQRIERLEAASR